jgi:hypothetical protein
MIVTGAVVVALIIVVWSAAIRIRRGAVRPATIALLVLAVVPFAFLYAAWIASDAWLSERVSRPGVSGVADFLVAGMISIAVLAGAILVGWEARRQRLRAMAILCGCAGALALTSIAVGLAMAVLLGLLSQLGATAGEGWR